MFLVEDEFVMTVKFVVIVESHPTPFAICEIYIPAVETIAPPGRVVVAPEQIEMFLDEEELGKTESIVVIEESQPTALVV